MNEPYRMPHDGRTVLEVFTDQQMANRTPRGRLLCAIRAAKHHRVLRPRPVTLASTIAPKDAL